jgi:adenylate cyclase
MRYRFSDCELDETRYALTRDGADVHVQPQVLDLLLLLLRNPGRLIGRDEIVEAIWQGRAISDSAVASRVKAARQAIGDDGQQQRFIQTVSRRGFRFIPPVEAIDDDRESVNKFLAKASAEPSGSHAPRPSSFMVENEFPSLPDKPSVAVLPFQNMSGDPDQDFFAEGVTEDILTALSKVSQLFVIARNSSFKYKGNDVDLRQVGRELGVKHVVEGSVRKAGKRVRVTAQLVECDSGGHLWADRFEGELDDVFDLQDRITEKIVTALEVTLAEGEKARIWHERSGSPLVYETFLKAIILYRNFSRQSHLQAALELKRTLELDPDYTPALFLYGYALVDLARFGWTDDRNAAFATALEMAKRAIAIDPYYADAYTTISYAQTFQGHHDAALVAAERAVALTPNVAGTLHRSAMSHIFAGNFEIGRNYEQQATRLNPMDQFVSLVELARAQYHLGDFEDARRVAAHVLVSQPRWLTAQTILVSALWRLGLESEACEIADKIIQGHNKFSVARWAKGWPYRQKEDLEYLIDPLRRAKLPK